MDFELVTPAKMVASQEADYIGIPGEDGAFGVLDGHAPVISTLKPGVVTIKSGEEETSYCVSYGFVDVTGKKVTMLAEDAVVISDISASEMQTKLDEIDRQLADLSTEHDSLKIAALTKQQHIFIARLEAVNH